MTAQYVIEYQKETGITGLYGTGLFHPCEAIKGYAAFPKGSGKSISTRCNKSASYVTFEVGQLSGRKLITHLCKDCLDSLMHECPDIKFINLDVLRVR